MTGSIGSRRVSIVLRAVAPVKFGILAALAFAGAAVAEETELPDGPGKAQVIEACSSCHAVTQVTSQARSITQWAEIVEQMIARGAPVSDDDYPVIVKYLGKYFAPASRPTAMRTLPPKRSRAIPQGGSPPVPSAAE
jgi:hypothetical protein